MKDAYEVLREKELELSRVELEVEALRLAAPLLSDDEEVDDDNHRTSARSTAPSRPVRIPPTVNASPDPRTRPSWP
jgi:hypothetical protein